MIMNKQVTDILNTMWSLQREILPMPKIIGCQQSLICNPTRSNQKLLKKTSNRQSRLSGHKKLCKDSDINLGKDCHALDAYYNTIQCIPCERLQSLFQIICGKMICNISQLTKEKASNSDKKELIIIQNVRKVAQIKCRDAA